MHSNTGRGIEGFGLQAREELRQFATRQGRPMFYFVGRNRSSQIDRWIVFGSAGLNGVADDRAYAL
ncbi:hypothetical protein BS642_10155 [Chromobacterium violaceum]|nr:hypothetical protein BS642_10155 [Chromobacterium violaceum]